MIWYKNGWDVKYKMKLLKLLTTVTSFSKILTAVLFAFLPFAGFYLGIKYEQKLTKYLEGRTTLNQYIIIKPSPYLDLFPEASASAEITSKIECEVAGGRWGRFGLAASEYCDLPPWDQ